MAEYAAWTRPDGEPFDPWLRVHRRLGARLLHPCERSMEVTGSVAEREEWTGMALPGTGSYTVPGALAPVEIDRAADTGRYTEPNVWAVHPCCTPGTGSPGGTRPGPGRRGGRKGPAPRTGRRGAAPPRNSGAP